MRPVDEIFRKQKYDALELFHSALDKMHPYSMVINTVDRENHSLIISDQTFDLSDGQKIWVAGSGKAAASMAEGLEDALKDYVQDGVIISPYGTKKRMRSIQQFQASHPVPDENSLAGTLELIDFIRTIPEGDILIYCLSGGSSSLLCLPNPELELDDIRETFHLLLGSGANIHEMNIVRKHLSQVKGGGLLQFINPGVTLIDLIISDVPDNRLEDIGSAPTIVDESSFRDAVNILKNYAIYDWIPEDIRNFLTERSEEDKSQEPKEWIAPDHHYTFLLGSAEMLAQEVGELARNKGYHVVVAEKPYNGDVRHVSKKICADAVSVLSRNEPVAKPAVLVYFGESTVEVRGDGMGGRNQELALAAALSVEGQHHITVLSIGTDGRDGPTDAAGAISNSETALLARKQNLEPEKYLADNDSYSFFKKMNDLVITGPTGNNLMDLQIVLVNK